MLRAVLPPLIAAYAIFLVLVLHARLRPAPRPRSGSVWLGPHREGLVRHLAGTIAGGYLVFIGIVAAFHSWLAAEADALRSALVEGSFLALGVFGVFAASARSPRALRRGAGPLQNRSDAGSNNDGASGRAGSP